jgi:hypothetical protein
LKSLNLLAGLPLDMRMQTEDNMKSPESRRANIQSQKRKDAMPAQKAPTALYNKTLSDVLQSIYSVYGSNLAAFFRDVEDPVNHGERRTEFHGHLVEAPSRERRRVSSER